MLPGLGVGTLDVEGLRKFRVYSWSFFWCLEDLSWGGGGGVVPSQTLT